MSTRRVVLVTGTPRSGTTPVGDALAAAPGARTLYEPLNFHVGDRRVQRYFEVPGAGGFTPETVDEVLRDVAALRLDLRPGVFPEDHGLRRLAKRVTGSRTLMTYRRARLDPRLRTIVWKDPFASFLVDRLADVHGVPVVVTVRPPAAVAASFKRLDWGFDVAGLVARLSATGSDYHWVLDGLDLTRPAHNATALWHIVNDRLLQAATRDSNVVVVDMDRYVADPAGVVHALFAQLGLRWTADVERHLEVTTAADGPAQPQGDRAHGARRDTRAVNRYWSEVLDAGEIDAVREVNAELWAHVAAASVTAG